MSPTRRDESLGSLLLVEDDEVFRGVLSQELSERGFKTQGAATAVAAWSCLEAGGKEPPEVILLDQRLPGMTGLNFLKMLRRRGLELPVIFLTGHGQVATAVKALHEGAFHFLTKPCELDELTEILERAVAHGRRCKKCPEEAIGDGVRMVGQSKAMQAVRTLILRMATSSAPVLISGESGTGKELAARLLHESSQQKNGSFVALNCAALQDTLVEAELFGHEKGAFTGAPGKKEGLIAAAAGGTLFLDEIAELSPSAQAKLLRVLEDGSYRRLGSTEEQRATARIVAASNTPLREAIEAKRFRQDLFYRMNTLEIHLPPLRERREDISLLLKSFYRSRGLELPQAALSSKALGLLESYGWPGNVRELYNVLERVSILSDPGKFDLSVLEDYFVMSAGPEASSVTSSLLADVEMRHILQVLVDCKGNKTQAAKRLGVSLKTLYNKLHRYEEQGGAPSGDEGPGQD